MPRKIEPAPPITEQQREQVLNNPDWKAQYDRLSQYSPRVAEEYLKVCWRIYHSTPSQKRGGRKHCPESRKGIPLRPKQEVLIVIRRAINFLGGSVTRDQIYNYLAQSVTPISKTRLRNYLKYLEENREIIKSGKRGKFQYSVSHSGHGDVQQRHSSAA